MYVPIAVLILELVYLKSLPLVVTHTNLRFLPLQCRKVSLHIIILKSGPKAKSGVDFTTPELLTAVPHSSGFCATSTPTVEESPPDVNVHVSDGGLPLPVQDGPDPLRIEGVNLANVLPSSAVKKDKLQTIEETQCSKFPTFILDNARKISAIFAQEAIFGVKVMARCTPLGAGKLLGLPI